MGRTSEALLSAALSALAIPATDLALKMGSLEAKVLRVDTMVGTRLVRKSMPNF